MRGKSPLNTSIVRRKDNLRLSILRKNIPNDNIIQIQKKYKQFKVRKYFGRVGKSRIFAIQHFALLMMIVINLQQQIYPSTQTNTDFEDKFNLLRRHSVNYCNIGFCLQFINIVLNLETN